MIEFSFGTHGIPNRIHALGRGRFKVSSFRKVGESYWVDLERNSCTCPHSKYRFASRCKHREYSKAVAALHAERIARGLNTADLRTHLWRLDLRPEVRGALTTVMYQRAARAASGGLNRKSR